MTIFSARRAFVITALIGACAVAALPYARDNSLFGGYGFGTVAAQTVYWLSWSALNHATGKVTNVSEPLMTGIWIVAAYAIFIAPAIVLRLILHPGNARMVTLTLVIWCTAFVVLFLAYPQAPVGP